MMGMIIFYVNVDGLDSKRADAAVEKIKSDNAETLGAIPDEWGVVFLQVQGSPTRVEVTPPLDVWRED
jgi:hypothetical protein